MLRRKKANQNLCVVVEPWPPLRFQSLELSAIPTTAGRAPSVSPAESLVHAKRQQESTPLFLPNYDRGISQTPAPVLYHQDGWDDINDDDDAQLLLFSQSVYTRENFQAGVEDDDEMDGAAFFGDADEAREF